MPAAEKYGQHVALVGVAIRVCQSYWLDTESHGGHGGHGGPARCNQCWASVNMFGVDDTESYNGETFLAFEQDSIGYVAVLFVIWKREAPWLLGLLLVLQKHCPGVGYMHCVYAVRF